MQRTQIRLKATKEVILVADLVNDLKRDGRGYIVQGQKITRYADHPKPKSLDYWLRTRSRHRDTKLADNDVLDQLVVTGLFSHSDKLICPDTGRKCKGLTLLGRADVAKGGGNRRSAAAAERIAREKTSGIPKGAKPSTRDSRLDPITIEAAITRLAEKYVSEDNDWYVWRKINEKSLPEGISLPKGNQYKKNVALKRQLYRKLREAKADQDKKKKLVVYYISKWGGIHNNSDKTLNEYVRESEAELMQRGSKGIASWSKLLCIRDPEQFAIFDARVSASLNALQIIHNVTDKQCFPVLSSQNKVVKQGIKLFRGQRWPDAPTGTFYTNYLRYLKSVASSLDKKLGARLVTIEMLLFAKAEDLIKQAFPEEKFS